MNALFILGLLLCLVLAEGYVLGGAIRYGRSQSRPATIAESVSAAVKQRVITLRLEASRRELCVQLASGFSVAFLPAAAAVASGGATAGGAYLLSAKQRYNDRVLKGVASFVAIRAAVEKPDIDAIRLFFTSEDAGAWKDFSAAGYLLANAFRRSSSTPPDSLPSVQKWKSYAAAVESMAQSLKKKDAAAALKMYDSALVKLDEYLTQAVELPALKEL